MSAQDMQLLEQLNLGLDDVARFWATPRPLLMLDTNSHYNDYQNATMEYLSRTISPDANDMQKEITRKLLGVKFYGMRDIHMCERPLLAMDLEGYGLGATGEGGPVESSDRCEDHQRNPCRA